jgi:hypothetical protein
LQQVSATYGPSSGNIFVLWGKNIYLAMQRYLINVVRYMIYTVWQYSSLIGAAAFTLGGDETNYAN